MKRALGYLLNFSNFKRQLLTIMLASMVASFGVIHLYSVIVGGSIHIKGYHLHHFYFGTAALALGGIVALLSTRKKFLIFASLLIGIGIGLFADEIGLLLTCTTENLVCTYYFPDTFDIVGTIIAILAGLSILIDPLERASTHLFAKAKPHIEPQETEQEK